MQLNREAVSVFKSSDESAPQLTATAGSFKTILEACLVTGYGSKQALDWEMPYSDATSACFKSKAEDSSGCYLKISNTGARYADVMGYLQMSALNKGEGLFSPSRYNRFPLLDSGKSTGDWVLVGNKKAFWFLLVNAYYGSYASSPLFFGDFYSFVSADTGNCALMHLNRENYSDLRAWSNMSDIRSSGGDSFAVAKSWDGLSTNAKMSINSACLWCQGSAYPDPITGGLRADQIDLHETATGHQYGLLRGRLPGLYLSAHNLLTIDDGTELDGFEDSEDRFMKFLLSSGDGRNNPRHHYLLNISHWYH